MRLKLKSYVALVSCACFLLAIVSSAQASRIYVVNGAGDTVDVIDSETDKVVQRIQGMEGAFATAFSPDRSRVYVSDEYKDLIYVVDRKTGKKVKQIPVGGHPSMIAISGDGRRLFVNLQNKPPVAGIEIIDTASLRTIKTIPMKGAMHDMCLAGNGKYLVSASDMGQFLVVVDLRTEQPIWDLKFDERVYTFAVESRPDGSPNRIFVQLRGFNGFTVVDFDKRQKTGDIYLPKEPSGFLGKFHNPSHGIGIAPDGKTLWVNSGEANSVFVYALAGLKVIGRVQLPQRNVPGNHLLGAQPNWLTFTPDGKKVYISDTWLNSVSAIDTATMKVVSDIPVGQLPRVIDTLALRE